MPVRLRRAVALVAALPLLLLPLAAGPAATAHAPPGRYAAIDDYVERRMAATGVPGLAYAVVGPGGPIHRRAWGTDGNGSPVTFRTPFLWGSVAKPVTATAVLALVDAGRLRLTDRVVDHLPEFRFGGPGHAAEVTVRHLLDHTSGIPPVAGYLVTDCLGSGCPRPAARLAALDDVRPLAPPGTAYAYTSANYLVLAAVVEAVTGRPLAEHLRTAVFEPAGMDGAVADAASAAARGLPPGHRLLWGVPAPITAVDEHGAGYGYLGGGLDDLAAFAALHLRSGATATGRAVLRAESAALMRRPVTLPGRTHPYGLGWRVGGLPAPLDTAIWHTGGVPGYSAMLFLLPERGLALVLQQNLYGVLHDEAVMEVGFGAARLLAGASPGGRSASAAPYHATVWGLTALALAMTCAAVRAARLLRRPARPVARRRRVAVTVAWCALGALPGIGLLVLACQVPLRQVWLWAPDGLIALAVAAAAGAVTAVPRLARAARSGGAGRRRAPATPHTLSRRRAPSRGTGGVHAARGARGRRR
jgi:Beta-lactamase class C and other penicillin binding proteins